MPTDVDAAKAQTLFGDYVEKVWWPTWKAQHPDSAYQTGKRIEKRILPFFGHLPFATLDADRVGAWKASLAGSGLKPASVNSYLSLLGTILNAAVDSDYLPHSPLMRKSRAGRVAAAKNLPVDRREVWVTRTQLNLIAQTITSCYRALVIVAALTGLRFGELAALRWDDVHLDKPLDDGAVAGPGRLRVIRGVSDPSRCGRDRRIKGPKTQAASGSSRWTWRRATSSASTKRTSPRSAAGWCSPPRVVPAALGACWPPTTSAASGYAPSSAPASMTAGPTTVACTFMTCGIRMRRGCWRCGCR